MATKKVKVPASWNAKPVTKLGGKPSSPRNPGKPYSKPAGKPSAAKPAPKPAAKPNSKASAPASNTRPGGAITMPNSARAGVNLPKTGARAERTATQIKQLRQASKPATKAVAGAAKGAGSLLRGGVIGGVGIAGADYIGTKAGNAIGNFLRENTNKPKEDRRSNRPGGGTRRTATTTPERQGPPVPERLRNASPAPQLPPPSTAASPRRSSGGGGSMPAAVTRKPASSTPKAPAAPAKPGQKFEDFNPNRGTSKSNNPLLDRDKGGIKLRDRMKERENRGGMKNFNTDVDVKADSPKSEDYSKANTSNQTSTAYRLNKLMGDKKKKKGY